MATPEEYTAALNLIATVGGIVREKGEIPAGELYGAWVLSHFPNLSSDVFNEIIDKLVQARLVKRSNHMLTWVEPKGS